MMTTALAPHLTSLSDAPSVAEAGHHATPWQDDERALLCRVAVQDQQAFATLYGRYAAPVRRYLRRCLGQADLVDDVLQEVMLVLWQRPSACPPTVPLIAWLCGIARHKARKGLARVAASVLSPQARDLDADDPERLVLCQEESCVLERALDALPFYERTALVLRVQHGWSYEEIAARMDTPLSTVRTRIARARQHLQRHMAGVPRQPSSPLLLMRSSREYGVPHAPASGAGV